MGAIFCNGSYINASDVEQCIQALNGVLTVKIEATASGSCSGNECSGEAQGKGVVSCSAAPAEPAGGILWAAGAAVAAAIAGVRRRTRR